MCVRVETRICMYAVCEYSFAILRAGVKKETHEAVRRSSKARDTLQAELETLTKRCVVLVLVLVAHSLHALHAHRWMRELHCCCRYAQEKEQYAKQLTSLLDMLLAHKTYVLFFVFGVFL